MLSSKSVVLGTLAVCVLVVPIHGLHVIKLEDRRTQTDPAGKSVEEVRARHILIGYKAPRDAQTSRDQARAAVEREKRDKFLNEIADRRRIVVSENFTVEAPAAS